MIIIKAHDGHEFKYYGNINLELGDEVFIKITADGEDPKQPDQTDELLKWQKYCIDLFWKEDIESIRGE